MRILLFCTVGRVGRDSYTTGITAVTAVYYRRYSDLGLRVMGLMGRRGGGG